MIDVVVQLLARQKLVDAARMIRNIVEEPVNICKVRVVLYEVE